jgi:copper chaperone CopZ
MRGKVAGLVTLFLFSVFTVFAADQSKKIEVKAGEECKAHIEKAAKSVEGVSQAEWNDETQELAVVFDDSKTNLDKIETAVANSGHDTPNHEAKADAKCENNKVKGEKSPKMGEQKPDEGEQEPK